MKSQELKKIMLEHYERTWKNDDMVIHFEFFGDIKESIDKEKINKIMDDIFKTKRFDHIMPILYYIRTILNPYEEKSLLIEIKDLKRNTYEKVIIENQKVKKYQKNILLKLSKSNEVYMQLKQNDEDGFSVHIPNQFDSMSLLPQNELEITNAISSSMQVMKDINEKQILDFMYFDRDEKTLVDLYQMFFHDNPNFQKDEVVGRTHSMIFLLQICGISFSNMNDFYISQENKPPYSKQVQTIINRLVPFGTIDYYRGDQITFSAEKNNNIHRIGKLICEFCNSFKNKEEILYTMASVLYATNLDQLKPEIKCSKELYQKLLDLFVSIEKNIHKQDSFFFKKFETLSNACLKYPSIQLSNDENMLKKGK